MVCCVSQVLLGLSKEALSLSQKKRMTDVPTQSKDVAQEKLDAAIKEHAAAQEVGTPTHTLLQPHTRCCRHTHMLSVLVVHGACSALLLRGEMVVQSLLAVRLFV